MPALNDRSFNPQAWAKLGLYAVGLLVVLGLVWASTLVHERYVETPNLLAKRFADPVGQVGMTSTRIAALGEKAVPTLVTDIEMGAAAEKSKSLELLSGIDDARVVPTLAKALLDKDAGVRLTAMAGLGRTGKPEAAKALWPITQSDNDMERTRAIVTLGLCGGEDDVQKLLDAAAKTGGYERALFVWSAGRVQRRLASLKAAAARPEGEERTQVAGYVPAAVQPETEEGVHKLQLDIDVVLADVAAGKDLRENGVKLNELTDVGFATWNQAHQIALQVLAIRGPERAFAMAGDALPMEPAKPSQQKLQLDEDPTPVAP